MRFLFDIRHPTTRQINVMLEALTRLNQQLIRAGNWPDLYTSGVRYKVEDTRRTVGQAEQFDTLDRVFARKHADCDKLAAWRAAELRERDGIDARAVCFRSGPGKFHAVVEFPNGEIEDPSRKLGMGGRNRGRR